MSTSTPLRSSSWAPRDVVRATLVVLGVVLAFGLLFFFRDLLFYLFVGIVLATAVKPLVTWLLGFGMPRLAAVCLVYGNLLLLLIATVVIGLPLIVGQAASMQGLAIETYHELRDRLIETDSRLLEMIGSRLPPQMPWLEEEPADAAVEATVAQAWAYSAVVLHAMFATLAVLLLAFFWSLHEPGVMRVMPLWIAPENRDDARELVEAMLAKVGDYVRAQVILCLTVGGMYLAVYWAVGLPNALVLAVLGGLLEAVPYFGPVLAAVPALLMAASVDMTMVVWVLVGSVVVQQLENYLLVPRIMDRSVGVNPVVTLLALAAFGSLMGFAGVVLAIPLAAMCQVLLGRFVLGADALEPSEPSGRDAVSRLRYEARVLVHDIRLHLRNKPDAAAAGKDELEELIESIAHDLDRALPPDPNASQEQTESASQGAPR